MLHKILLRQNDVHVRYVALINQKAYRTEPSSAKNRSPIKHNPLLTNTSNERETGTSLNPERNACSVISGWIPDHDRNIVFGDLQNIQKLSSVYHRTNVKSLRSKKYTNYSKDCWSLQK